MKLNPLISITLDWYIKRIDDYIEFWKRALIRVLNYFSHSLLKVFWGHLCICITHPWLKKHIILLSVPLFNVIYDNMHNLHLYKYYRITFSQRFLSCVVPKIIFRRKGKGKLQLYLFWTPFIIQPPTKCKTD